MASPPTSEVGLEQEEEPGFAQPVRSRIELLLEKMLEQQLPETPNRNVQNNNTVVSSQLQLPNFNPSSKMADPEGWCALVDEFVNVNNLQGMRLITSLSNALQGEAADWLIKSRPLFKTWPEIKEEFLAVFSKPADLLEMFEEAVNGRQNSPEDTTLLDEGLHVIRLALHLIKTRESDEALATLFACHVVGSRSEVVKRKLQNDVPKDLKGFCVAMRGPLGKRPALSRPNHHINPKRRAFAEPSTNLMIKCHLCGKLGHKSYQCDNKKVNSSVQRKSTTVTCFKCGKQGHVSTNCYTKEKQGAKEKLVNVCTKLVSPKGQLECNGKIVPFIFDSGSDCSLVRESISKLFCGKQCHCLISLKGIGNSTIVCTKQIISIVKIENLNIELVLHVVPDNSVSYDVILGRDLISNNIVVKFDINGLAIMRELTVNICENIINLDSVNTDIKGNEKNDLIAILRKYKSYFVNNLPIHEVKTGELEIRLKDENKFVQRRPYRMSMPEREIVRSKINELIQANVIRPSNSPFASPMILVKKKDGTDRLCIDYRELNSNTVPDKYPLPLIGDQINRLHGAYYFTTLDMISGFHQIPVSSISIEKTAFVCSEGQFEFLKMPFGLTNAPSVYQRAIDKALGNLRNTCAITYIDDILIPSKTIFEGLEKLELVLEALTKAGFSLNFQKCKFLKIEVNFLGYLVRAGEIRPNSQKTLALINSKIPSTPTQVRQFLGLASYFRQFIPNFSKIAAPLYQLTSKVNKTIKWLPIHDNARSTLIKCLTDQPVLKIFNPDLAIELHTDASSNGFGGILLQKENSKLHAVGYFSKRTSEVESRYHSYELETLAVVYAVKHFRHFLYGNHFTVVTDCNSLKASKQKSDLTPRVHRWWAYLQAFDFDIQYRNGVKMKHADFFSRNLMSSQNESDESLNSIRQIIHIIDLQKDWLVVAQQQDDEITNLIAKWKSDELPLSLLKIYDVRNKVLLRKIERNKKSTWLPVVPKAMAWSVINHIHSDIKHLGWEKTLDKLYEFYWFPNMSKNVRKFVDNCLVCKTSKGKTGPQQIQLHSIPKITKPWHTVHIDISGKLSGKSDKKEYVLVIIDAFTKFVLLFHINVLSGSRAIQCLKEFVYIFGAPSRIITDQGRCFTSSEFKIFCTENNIDLHFIAHCSSRANGQVERIMQTLKNKMTAIESEGNQSWQESLGELQLALNSTKQKTTGFSPAELLFGTNIKSLNLNQIVHKELNISNQNDIDLNSIREQASSNMVKAALKDTERFNKGKAKIVPFVGDFVLAKFNERMLSKLDPKFRGPFKILKVLPHERYEVTKVTSKGKSPIFKFAHEQLRKVPSEQANFNFDFGTDEPVSAREISNSGNWLQH